MSNKKAIPASDEAWDAGELGRDEEFVKAIEGDEGEIDKALELQLISIRLQKSLIEDFKLIARLNGIGYQPLMRQILQRFADCEKKRILRDLVSDAEERRQKEKEAALVAEGDQPPLRKKVA